MDASAANLIAVPTAGHLPAGPWMMQRSRLDAMLATRPVARVPASAAPAADPPKPYAVSGGVALIAVAGVMFKDSDPLYDWFGVQYTSTADAARAFAAAQADPAVVATLLYVDSPGGQVAGTGDLADLVYAATKPTAAYVSDLAASAAYYVASQCDAVYVNPTGWVGSIGTYWPVYDLSKAAADAGVTVHIVKAGEHKGDLEDGTAVTSDQLAEVQKVVDTCRDQFVSAVARGRGVPTSTAAGWSTGQIWPASDAQAMGLVDGVATAEQVTEVLRNMSTTTSQTGTTTAAASPATVATVGLEDFTARLAGARSEGHAAGVAAERERVLALADMAEDHPSFALTQIKGGSDMATAAKAYAAHVKQQAQQAKTLDPSNGVPPLNAARAVDAGATSDPEQEWAGNVGGVQQQFGNKHQFLALRKHQARVAGIAARN